jgi:hypothetical protein
MLQYYSTGPCMLTRHFACQPICCIAMEIYMIN